MTEKQKTTLIIFAFLGLLGLAGSGYYTFVMAKSKIKLHDREVATLSKAIDEGQAKLDSLKGMMANKERVEANRVMIQKITQRLPNSPDAPGFIQALVTVLRMTGILQQSVKPSPTQNRTQYTEIPYSILAFGRYHEIGQFLALIEQNQERFMRVKSIKISNNLKRPSIHPISIQIGTFMFNNPPPPPKPTPVATPEPKKGKKKAKEE